MQSRKAGFPFATRARKREPCLQRYVSRMTWTENFLSQFFSKFFWKQLFSTFYGTLFIISRKYFFGFSKSALRTPHLPLDTPFWTRGFSLVMRSRKAGFPFATRARKREPCPQRYVSRMIRKPLLSTFHGTLFIISRKYFSVFRSLHLPLDTPFWTRCFPLVMRSRKAGFPFATRARKREPCPQISNR